MVSSKLLLIVALLALAATNAQRLRGSESTGQTIRGLEGVDSAELHHLKSHELSPDHTARVRTRPKKEKRSPKLTNKQKKARNQADAIDFSIADSISGRTQAEHARTQENEEDAYLVGGKHADKMAPRIINGDEALRGKYTFAVSLQDNIGHFCGGSLIARDYVLSAGHCQGGRYDVIVGRHDLKKRDGQAIGVDKEIVHPKYNSRTTDNDYMLLRLRSPADNQYDVIAPNSSGSKPSVGSSVDVMGWGDIDIRDNVNKLSDVLMTVDVNVMSNRDCDDSEGYIDGSKDDYNGQITSNMLCANDVANREDSCQGDSGGPLVQGDSLVGVVSWGVGCATREFPGVYARVSSAYNWIEDEVCRNSKYKPGWCGGGGGSSSANAPSEDEPSTGAISGGSGSGSGGSGCRNHDRKSDCQDAVCKWDKRDKVCTSGDGIFSIGGKPGGSSSSSQQCRDIGNKNKCKNQGCSWSGGQCSDFSLGLDVSGGGSGGGGSDVCSENRTKKQCKIDSNKGCEWNDSKKKCNKGGSSSATSKPPSSANISSGGGGKCNYSKKSDCKSDMKCEWKGGRCKVWEPKFNWDDDFWFDDDWWRRRD